MGEITNTLNSSPPRALPSDTKRNLTKNVVAITLRSGKKPKQLEIERK